MSDIKLKKSSNGSSGAQGAGANGNGLANPSQNDASDNAAINKLAANASPRQMKRWIARLEVLYEEKRMAIRNELKSQLDDLLDSNDYTIEELYTARPIPSTSELAEQSEKRKSETQSKRDQAIKGICGV